MADKGQWKRLLINIRSRILQDSVLQSEYEDLENVGPAPGQPWEQHESMVRQNLCSRAVANQFRNRYSNLFPFDENTVRLKNDGDTDYINASWITLDEKDERKYIVTMGPMHPSSYNTTNYKPDFGQGGLADTSPDFWRMCWQTNAPIVVMLCEIQMGFVGCSRYFPKSESPEEMYGNIRVKLVAKETHGHAIKRTFVYSLKGEEKRLLHFQFTGWPNYDVPASTDSLAEFVLAVHEAEKHPFHSRSTHMIIHCSGGVGRSGTFLAVLHSYRTLLKTLKQDRSVPDDIDLRGVVLKMRKQRHPWMVEGPHQYKTAYLTLFKLVENLYQETKKQHNGK